MKKNVLTYWRTRTDDSVVALLEKFDNGDILLLVKNGKDWEVRLPEDDDLNTLDLQVLDSTVDKIFKHPFGSTRRTRNAMKRLGS